MDGSSDKYLVVVSSLRNKKITNALDKIWYGHLLKIKLILVLK